MVAPKPIQHRSGVFPVSGYVSLHDAGIILSPEGDPADYHAVWRWIKVGVTNTEGKRVKLVAQKLPKALAVSAQELAAFARALNGQGAPSVHTTRNNISTGNRLVRLTKQDLAREEDSAPSAALGDARSTQGRDARSACGGNELPERRKSAGGKAVISAPS